MESWRSMTKIAGSGYISQRHVSADPDPSKYHGFAILEESVIFPTWLWRGMLLLFLLPLEKTMEEECSVPLMWSRSPRPPSPLEPLSPTQKQPPTGLNARPTTCVNPDSSAEFPRRIPLMHTDPQQKLQTVLLHCFLPKRSAGSESAAMVKDRILEL